MPSVNKVILVGNVGKDPEIRYVEKDLAVATFSLATSERYTKDGKTIEHTEWHRITAWRGLAKIAEQYIKKGTQLYVEGKLQTRNWADQQGQQHYVTEIVANDIQLLGKRPQDGTEKTETENKTEEPPVSFQIPPVAEDNMPF